MLHNRSHWALHLTRFMTTGPHSFWPTGENNNILKQYLCLMVKGTLPSVSRDPVEGKGFPAAGRNVTLQALTANYVREFPQILPLLRFVQLHNGLRILRTYMYLESDQMRVVRHWESQVEARIDGVSCFSQVFCRSCWCQWDIGPWVASRSAVLEGADWTRPTERGSQSSS